MTEGRSPPEPQPREPVISVTDSSFQIPLDGLEARGWGEELEEAIDPSFYVIAASGIRALATLLKRGSLSPEIVSQIVRLPLFTNADSMSVNNSLSELIIENIEGDDFDLLYRHAATLLDAARAASFMKHATIPQMVMDSYMNLPIVTYLRELDVPIEYQHSSGLSLGKGLPVRIGISYAEYDRGIGFEPTGSLYFYSRSLVDQGTRKESSSARISSVSHDNMLKVDAEAFINTVSPHEKTLTSPFKALREHAIVASQSAQS